MGVKTKMHDVAYKFRQVVSTPSQFWDPRVYFPMARTPFKNITFDVRVDVRDRDDEVAMQPRPRPPSPHPCSHSKGISIRVAKIAKQEHKRRLYHAKKAMVYGLRV